MKYATASLFLLVSPGLLAGGTPAEPGARGEVWTQCDQIGCGDLTWPQMMRRSVQDITGSRAAEILNNVREAPVAVSLDAIGCVLPAAGGGTASTGLNAHPYTSPRTLYNVVYDVQPGTTRVRVSLGLDGRVRGNPTTSEPVSTSILFSSLYVWQGAPTPPSTPSQYTWIVGGGISANSLWSRATTDQFINVDAAQDLNIRVDAFFNPSLSPLWVAANVMVCRPRLIITPIAD